MIVEHIKPIAVGVLGVACLIAAARYHWNDKNDWRTIAAIVAGLFVITGAAVLYVQQREAAQRGRGAVEPRPDITRTFF